MAWRSRSHEPVGFQDADALSTKANALIVNLVHGRYSDLYNLDTNNCWHRKVLREYACQVLGKLPAVLAYLSKLQMGSHYVSRGHLVLIPRIAKELIPVIQVLGTPA
jgi:hypothetical protein